MKEVLGKASSVALAGVVLIGLNVAQAYVPFRESGIGILWTSLVVVGALVAFVIVDGVLTKRAARKFKWLYCLSKSGLVNPLPKVEAAARQGSTVYLVTPDMHNDANEMETIECVRANLERGVRYVYVTKNSDPTAEGNVKCVHHHFARYKDAATVYVANDLFDKLPTYNILIVEFDAEGRQRVFVELPVVEASRGSMRRLYWAEASVEFANSCRDKVMAALRDRVPERNPYLPDNMPGMDRNGGLGQRSAGP